MGRSGLLVLVWVGAIACDGATGLNADDVPAVVLARDSFGRHVPRGWGSADVGGNYYLNTMDPFRVADGSGIIELVGTSPENAALDAAYGLHVRGLVRFRVDRLPDSGFHMVQVYARRDDTHSDGDNYYRFRVRAHANRQMDVRVQKNIDDHATFVTDIIPIGLSFDAGSWFWIRWEATGPGHATHLRMRVWRDGTAEPGVWPIDVVHDEPRLERHGTTGVWVQAAVQQSTWPLRFSFKDLLYEEVPPR